MRWLVGAVLVAGLILGACALFSEDIVDDDNAARARVELSDMLWPQFVAMLEDDHDIPEEDKDRLYRALGVLLALQGKITVETADEPGVLVARAGSLIREFSYERLSRLTREVRDAAKRQEVRMQMDNVTLDAARLIIGDK